MKRILSSIIISIAVTAAYPVGADEIESIVKNIPHSPLKVFATENGKNLVLKYRNEPFFIAFLNQDWNKAFIEGSKYLEIYPGDPVAMMIASETGGFTHRLLEITLYSKKYHVTDSKMIIKIVDFCNTYLAQNTNSSMAWFLKGLSYFYKKETPQKPLAAFIRSFELDNKNAFAAAFAGYFYQSMSGETDTDVCEELIPLYQYALQLDSGCYPAANNLMMCYYYTGIDKKTIYNAAWELIEVSPFSMHAHSMIVHLTSTSDIRISPDNKGGYSIEPKQSLNNSQYDLFINEIEKRFSGSPYGYWSFAKYIETETDMPYLALNFWEKAYDLAADVTDKSFILCEMLNFCYLRSLGNEGEKYYEMAEPYQNGVFEAEIRYHRSMICFITKDYKTGIDLLLGGLGQKLLFTEKYYYLSNLGTLYLMDKQNSEAIRYLSMALEEYPYDVISLVNLGVAYENTKDYDSAKKYYEIALHSPESTGYKQTAKEKLKILEMKLKKLK
jgi:tetratricopeptide (TPR) repeat protein